jgi:uroporphyrinogen-III synthase
VTTVAITTSRDRYDEAARPFTEQGFTPIALPCITVEVADEDLLTGARSTANGVDLLFVTSARTIRLLWPDGAMPAVPVAAIGVATARAVTRAGGNVAVVGTGGGLDLIDRVRALPRVRRALFPHAGGTDPNVLAAFRATVTVASTIPIYRTVPVAPDADPVDAVAFASASAVMGWFLTRDTGGTIVGAIGRPTVAALGSFGATVDAVPDVPGFASMASALREVIT